METSKPAWILLQNGYGMILGFLTYLLIIRDAGLNTWGVFSAALSFGMIFAFISDLGINTAHTRMIAFGGDRNEYNNALVLIKLFLTAAFIGVIFLAMFVWTVVLHQKFSSPYVYLSILFLIPYFIGLPYIRANRAFFTGTQEAFKLSFPPMMETTTRFMAVVILIHFNIFHIAGPKSGIPEMALLIAASYSISYVVYTVVSFAVGMPWNFKMPHLDTIKKYFRYSYPLVGVAVTSTISSSIAQFLIYISIGSHPAGGYASIWSIVLMITGFTTSITILILPVLTTQMQGNGDYRNTMRNTVKYLAFFVTPITVFIGILATPVLNLWTSALIPFSFPLQIMLIGSWFWTMSIPFWTHFNAVAKTKISGVVNIFGYTLLIVLDVVLIPRTLADIHFAGMGVLGASYAYLFSGIGLLILSMLVLVKEVKSPVNIQTIVSVCISLLVGAAFYYLLRGFERLPALVILGLFITYSLVYVGLLIATKTLTKKELLDILNMLNVLKLGKYALDEMRKSSQ